MVKQMRMWIVQKRFSVRKYLHFQRNPSQWISCGLVAKKELFLRQALHLWTSLKIGSSLIAPMCRGGWSRSEASERLFWQWWNGRDERKGFWLQSAQILRDTSDSLYSIPGHQKIPVIQLSKFKNAPDDVRGIGLKINWVFINIPEEVSREWMYEFSFAHWHKDSHFFGYKVETGLRNCWVYQTCSREQNHLPRWEALECATMRYCVEGAAKSLHLPRLHALQTIPAMVSVEGNFDQGTAWRLRNHFLQVNDVPRFPEVIDQESNWCRMGISDLTW